MAKNKRQSPRHKIDKKLKEIRLDFFVHIQKEEDIGVKTEEETEKIMDEHDDEHNQYEEQCKTNAQPLENRKRAFQDNQVNNIGKRSKTDYTTEDSEKKSIFSEVISYLEDQIDGISRSQEELGEMYDAYSSSHPDEIPDKSKLETLNLYKAYKHLQGQIDQLDEHEKQDCSNLLDVEVCIQNTHEILMKGVVDGNKTTPGEFSTSKRNGEFKGVMHHYPRYSTEKVAYAAVQTIIDHYDNVVYATKSEVDNLTAESLEKIFKYAATFLFTFLQLHPFCDGNGRLGRLLCSYFLGLVCPFPSPIYNVYSKTKRSDFVETLIDARTYFSNTNKSETEVDAKYRALHLNSQPTDSDIDKELWISDETIVSEYDAKRLAMNFIRCKPSNLCALIIESNWSTWQKCFEINDT